MAVDVTQQAYQAIYQFVQKIIGDRDEAAAYAEDPQGYLAAEGVGNYDLAGVNMQQAVQQAVQGSNAPQHVQQSVQQGYAGGGGGGGYAPPPSTPPAGVSPADYLVQHVNYVTYSTYEGDDYISQQLINQENYDYSTNIDNSVNLDGKFYGDVELDVNNVNATGDGAVAAGEDVYGAATGDGAVAAGGDINAPVNTGNFTGVQAGGDVTNTAVGDYNTQSADVNINAEDGSAVAFGEGSHADAKQEVDVYAENSNVQVGDGTAYQDQEIDQSVHENEVNVDAYQSQVGVQAAAGEDIYQDQHQHAEVNLNQVAEEEYGEHEQPAEHAL